MVIQIYAGGYIFPIKKTIPIFLIYHLNILLKPRNTKDLAYIIKNFGVSPNYDKITLGKPYIILIGLMHRVIRMTGCVLISPEYRKAKICSGQSFNRSKGVVPDPGILIQATYILLGIQNKLVLLLLIYQTAISEKPSRKML